MEQKKFMDISRVKLGDDGSTPNTEGFEVGDIIQITEKWDGSNASIRYNTDTGKIASFSRKTELSKKQTLRGFWDFVQKLNPEEYKDTPNYVIFGEWGVKNSIRYNDEAYNKWYVYDIFDMDKDGYLPQAEVKKFSEKHGLLYIHTLYEGEFISWEHCMSFCNSPAYGKTQEGIVIKNQSKLNNPDSRKPFVLKIVNEGLAEIKKENRKETKEELQQMVQSHRVVEMIVTRRRVEKELCKMCDEGIIPKEITRQHIGILAKNLPKRVFEDCLKEEMELIQPIEDRFGKMCEKKVMKIVYEMSKEWKMN